MMNFYKTQMRRYGESYASGLYIAASFILAVSGTGLHKHYDEAAGIFYFICDIAVLLLQYINRFQKIRSFLLFGGSLIGSFILLAGGFFDDLHNASGNIEWMGAIVRNISNSILVFASFIGVMTLFPKIKIGLPETPGNYYMASYVFFFLFACAQMTAKPSLSSAGYIAATFLWVLAGNAIRLKYDEGTK